MPLDTGADVKTYVLQRADEATDGTSDFDGFIYTLMLEKQEEILTRGAWIGLLAYPPQAFLAPAALTTYTVTVAAGSAVVGVLSGAPAISVKDWWLIPSGKTWFARITAHVAANANVTLDVVPEALAGVACVLVKMEHDILATTGVLADQLWTDGNGSDGDWVPVIAEEELKIQAPGLPYRSWPPRMAARISQTKIRLSDYDIAAHRVEVPYYAELADPGASALGLPKHLRVALAEGTLALLYEMKGDARRPVADARFETLVKAGKGYDHLLRVGLGTQGGQRRNEPYGENASHAFGSPYSD